MGYNSLHQCRSYATGEELRLRDSGYDRSFAAILRRIIAIAIVVAVPILFAASLWSFIDSAGARSHFFPRLSLYLVLFAGLGCFVVTVAGVAGFCHALVFSEWLLPGKFIVYRFFRKRVFSLDRSRITVRKWVWFYYSCRISAENGNVVVLKLLTDAEVKLFRAYIDASLSSGAASCNLEDRSGLQ